MLGVNLTTGSDDLRYTYEIQVNDKTYGVTMFELLNVSDASDEYLKFQIETLAKNRDLIS